MTDLCSVPGCLHYVVLWKLVRKGEDRYYVGFCNQHARLGPYEQRRLL